MLFFTIYAILTGTVALFGKASYETSCIFAESFLK